jgi:hypothetical protein
MATNKDTKKYWDNIKKDSLFAEYAKIDKEKSDRNLLNKRINVGPQG